MNTVITFAGNLAEDPELQFTPQGTPVVDFRVLVNRRIKDGDEWKDGQATAHNCKLYGKTAENVAESIARGDRVLVHGQVRTETWNDRETGEKRYKDLVIVEEIGTSLKFAVTRIEKAARAGESSAQAEDPWSTPNGEL